jgi:hypothetical protein
MRPGRSALRCGRLSGVGLVQPDNLGLSIANVVCAGELCGRRDVGARQGGSTFGVAPALIHVEACREMP